MTDTKRRVASRPVWSHILVLILFFSYTNSWQPTSAIASEPTNEADDTTIFVTPEAAPLAVYHKAWSIVSQSYYDPTFNSQDWSRWEHKYDRQIVTNRDAHKAIETMFESLGDRYTRYIHRSLFDDERAQIVERFGGVGLTLGIGKTGRISVIAPIRGTPAARAGLQTEDEIVAIDGKSIQSGASVFEAVRYIRGRIGTKVVLTVDRENRRKHISLTRDEILVHGVSDTMMLDKSIGYILISSLLDYDSPKYMREALQKLRDARGIILDLRNDPGGLLANALELSSLFLDEGVVVLTSDRNGNQTAAHAENNSMNKQPLVILVDEGTASAAEIIAAALRDHGRAVIVGQKTFGKGLVQSISRLADGGGINLTVARYLSPAGHEIQNGILPDHQVAISAADKKSGKGPWFTYGGARSPKDGKDVQLAKAIEVLRAKTDSPGQCIVKGQIQHSVRKSFISGFSAQVVGMFTSVFRTTRRFIFDLFDDLVA